MAYRNKVWADDYTIEVFLVEVPKGLLVTTVNDGRAEDFLLDDDNVRALRLALAAYERHKKKGED